MRCSLSTQRLRGACRSITYCASDAFVHRAGAVGHTGGAIRPGGSAT